MKARVFLVALVCFMGLATLTVGNAEAGAWYTCTVSKVGNTSITGSTNYFVNISEINGAFTGIYALLDTGNNLQKEMLASALTAYANSSNVWVYLESITSGSTAFGLAAIK